MNLSVLDFIVNILGIAIIIAYDFKVEGDKYEESKEDFNFKLYAKKNVFDFVFYLLGGLGGLFAKGLIFAAMNLPHTDLNLAVDYSSSLLAGLVGSFVLGSFIDQARKFKKK